MQIILKYKKRRIRINAKKCNFLRKAFGLMFKRREKAHAILFNFGRPVKIRIHSIFVFFDFIAVWLDEKNKVIEIRKIKPFTFFVVPKQPFTKLLEFPINKKYSKVIKLLFSRR